MATYPYTVLAFKQQTDSPIQVAFVAHAGEIMNWVGVPRKSDELLTGYQRFRDRNRINQEIVPFFQNPQNCSPTAIIVSLRGDSKLGRCTLETTDIPPGSIVPTKLFIEVDEEALNTNRVFEAALQYVNSRLDTTEEARIVSEESPGDEDTILDEEVTGDDTGDDTDEVEEIDHLGTATLQRMKELLDDRQNWENTEFQQAISDYVKPAFIIDGQHRVAAAAQITTKGLPFIVCGLFDAPWEEQVFQFTVVNLKPKRLPPSLVTSIAGLSLTRTEQERVEQRLNQAGIRMTEVAIMSLVAYDDASPFAEKIDMNVGSPRDREDKLGYVAMKRIAKEWFAASRTSLTLIAKAVFSTNSASRARAHWRSERVWFHMFCSFWNAVRNHYPTNLWQKTTNNRLFIGAQLWALQEAILRQADGQVPSYWQSTELSDIELEERIPLLENKLLEVVTTNLAYFPVEMWTIPWAKSSFDTHGGREELIKLFNQFIDEGKKAGFWKGWKRSELFNVSRP